MTQPNPVTTRIRVQGMDCASCATKIEKALRRVPGVTDVNVSVAGGSVTVEHGGADTDTLAAKVIGLGYTVTPADRKAVHARHGQGGASHDHHVDAHGHDHGTTDGSWWRTSKGILTIASGAALGAAFLIGKLEPATEKWAFLLAMLVGLVPIGRRAFAAAISGTPFSIEMLMTIAAVGAVFIGATEEAAAVVFLFLIGELLEGVAASRARASIQDLTKLVPKIARLEENGQVQEVQADTLVVGSMIQVRPGDRIPADGLIVSGESSVDEAPVTGESTPVRKGPEETLFAGTINGDGLLSVRVSAAAADNTIAPCTLR